MRNENNVHTKTHMQISSFIHSAENLKWAKCWSTSEWINKLWYSHTMEYYSVMRRSGLLIHVPMWMNLQSQTKKLHTVWLHLLDIWQRQNIRDKNQISGCHGSGVKGGLACKRTQENSWGGDRNILYLDFGDAHRICICQSHRTAPLKWWILLYVNYTLIKWT